MEAKNMKITLMAHTSFLKKDGTFDMEAALTYLGKIGGICYNKDGLQASFQEPIEKTRKRVEQMTSKEHQSVFEHAQIGLSLESVPKILNMTLNNEQQYTTSERSLRYTPVARSNPFLTDKEIELYYKWVPIFEVKIRKAYPCLKDGEIEKLAQENARYLTSVFIATSMVHTIPLAQLNRISVYMEKYIETAPSDSFKERLVPFYQEFLQQLKQLNVLDPRLQSNFKHRSLKIFGSHLDSIPEEFGQTYCTTYTGSYASFAQTQRTRPIYYQMERQQQGFYVPPIIRDEPILVNEWLTDMEQVMHCFPQGELITINEQGTFDAFVLKMKERECSAAQLEINQQTTRTRDRYYKSLQEKGERYQYLARQMSHYMHGQRCTFPDYDCPNPAGCKLPGDRVKQLRKI